jgi:hypothetical protein
VYRFRAMLPPFVGWNPNSRSDLVYRGQVTRGFGNHPRSENKGGSAGTGP